MTNTNADLFCDFAASSKAEWQAQVQKDLKGKVLEDLQWQLGEDFSIAPIYHSEDNLTKKMPFFQKNDWEICEKFDVTDERYVAANHSALEALMGGANALYFVIGQNISIAEMETLLAKIELSYISIHFFYTGKKIRFVQKKLEHFYNIAKKKGQKTDLLQGSLQIAPLGSEPNWEELQRLVNWAKVHLPCFKSVTINACEFHTDTENVVDELTKTLLRANQFLTEMTERGMSATQANAALQFSISIDKSYFINIAKIRALKLLYLNVMSAYGLDNEEIPPIEAHFASTSFDENNNTNSIRATTMAMSAVVGGVNRLTVLPSDKMETSFGRRIARNVQHLLKMESYLDKVADPAAGSYYVEQLSETIATKVWAKFSQH